MIHHDYILRLIEEFARALARIADLRRGQQPDEAARTVEFELQRILGVDRVSLLRLSTTELLARLVRTGSSLEAQHKLFFLVRLLKESGDLASEQGDTATGRAHSLQALLLLLDALQQPDLAECPQYVPTVDAIVESLAPAPLPPEILALLMRHYEGLGDFARAEDAFFDLLEATPPSPEIVGFGNAFYRRLLGHSDAALAGGNFSRAEATEGLAEFRRRATG